MIIGALLGFGQSVFRQRDHDLGRHASLDRLLSVYLVGFQLPLSGIVLALPDGLVNLCRPFITAYWAWAGYFATMIDTRLYDAFRLESNELIPNTGLASCILGLHAACGVFLVFYGCIQKRPL